MNVNNNQNLNFTARNKTIRFADDIARKVNREFPCISSTKIYGLHNAHKYPCVIRNLARDIYKMRNSATKKKLHSKNILQRAITTIELIKNNKRANCGEFSVLATIIARINGIENCNDVSLAGTDDFNYDHAVVLVNDKKPYIIDAWLGFADYLPNAIKRYQNEFRNYFDFDKSKDEKMFINQESFEKKPVNNITSADLDVIKEIFPEMVIQRSK